MRTYKTVYPSCEKRRNIMRKIIIDAYLNGKHPKEIAGVLGKEVSGIYRLVPAKKLKALKNAKLLEKMQNQPVFEGEK